MTMGFRNYVLLSIMRQKSNRPFNMQEAAIGIIFSEDENSVLIIQRCDVDVWVLPGGGIDKDELPEDAVIREVFEETGLQVSIKRKVGEYTPINKLSAFTHVFECDILSGAPKTSSESRQVAFYRLDKLPKSFFPVHKDWLLDALKNDPGILRKPIASVTYFQVLKYFCQHPFRVVRYLLSRFRLSE